MFFIRGPEKKNQQKETLEVLDNELSESSTDTSITSTTRRAFEEEIFSTRMINIIRECAIFCFFMAAYVALNQHPPKVLSGPTAYPFFGKNSLVVDWYRGQINLAIEHAKRSDLAFVMFYAPWDAESQAARGEFEIAAKYMHDRISFVAVNCWQPGGECRSHYNKVYGWPVLIAYPSSGRGVQYNGPLIAGHMISFLQRVCTPVKRYQKDIDDFRDGYVVAELNAYSNSVAYDVFYTTALKYLEKDPYFKLNFFVKPKQHSNLTITLTLWNETKTSEVFSESEWKPDTILKWIFDNGHQASAWISPTGSKGSLLASSLQPAPALILFTPKNPLHQHTDFYYLLQEVAQEFNKCENYTLLFDLRERRIKNFIQHAYLENICSVREEPSQMKIVSHKIWSNSSNCALIAPNTKRGCSIALDRNVGYICYESSSENCVEYTNANGKKMCNFKKYDTGTETVPTSMLRSENDYRSMENLRKLQEKEKCQQYLAAQKLHSAIFENPHFPVSKVNITGLGCSLNKSLNFYAMDGLLYYHFAERLGVDLSKNHDNTAAVIIDDIMETHYILDEPVTGDTLRQFVKNFTLDTLKRSLKSSTSVKSLKTHTYDVKNHPDDIFAIEELQSETFLPTILQNDKAVVVMFYSKQCAFCNGVSHMFITAARKFRYIDNLIFARIDGDVNLLPWEYTMEKYPRILFFPSKNKAESRVFPSSAHISVPNLIWFVLSNLEPNQKLTVLWSMCNQTHTLAEKASCFSTLQKQTLVIIENTLKSWRVSNKRQKQSILYNLKQLKQLQILFGSSITNEDLVELYLRRLDNRQTEDYRNL